MTKQPRYLLALTPTSIRHIRPLSPQEEDAFLEAIDHLARFDRSRQAFDLVLRNDEELRRALAEAGRFTPASSGAARTEARVLGLNANRSFLNYLTACRFFHDSTKARIRRRRESFATEAFEEAHKAAKRASFAYRFMWALRDFAQHVDLPITRVLLNSRMEQHGITERHVHELTFAVDTDYLLKHGGHDWARLSADLRSRPSQLPLLPLIAENTREVARLDDVHAEIQRPSLSASAETIATIGAEAIREGATPAMGAAGAVEGTRATLGFAQPPAEIMHWLGCDWFKTSIG